MAYYITVEDKKGHYLPLDISKSDCFTRLSNLKGAKANLQEIDYFTTQFNDELEMRYLLIKKGVLPFSLKEKKLSLRQIKNGTYIKVMYDFLYQKDIDYIAEPKKLITLINDRLLTKDYRFILEYANFYLNYHDCASTAPEVREFINYTINTGNLSRHFADIDKNGDTPLTRMTKLLIYENYNSQNGQICYNYNKTKYRNIHSIIAFINNYDKKHQKIEEQLFEKEISKKRTLKKNDVPEQLSLFDN